MKIFIPSFVLLFCFACSTPKPKPEVIQAETTTRDADKGETFEKAPDVGNEARTEKQKNFLAGQKAYEVDANAEAIKFLTLVVNDTNVDEMNYFAASLLFDALAKEKKYVELCTQVQKSAEDLCGPKSNVSPDQMGICKDIYNIQGSCTK